MKKFTQFTIASVLACCFIFGITGPTMAATNPTLGVATTFGVLSSTFSNSSLSTRINGDVGYTTPPGTAFTLIGSLYTDVSGIPAGDIYQQAGTGQANALTNLNSQGCTFSFAAGAIDLATDMTHVLS